MIEISDINSSGMGVCRHDGIVTFVPYTITGEKAEIEITSKQKNYNFGKVVNLIEESVDRRIPPCPYYGKCGGCSLMHMSYNRQLKTKENIVRHTLSRIGKVNCDINPILPSKSELGYRNKAAFPVKDGKIGYYMAGSHNIVEISSCPLVCSEINEVLKSMRPFVKKHGGNITHVVVRSTGGSTMVTVVTKERIYKDKTQLIDTLSALNADSININYNTNPRHILGKKTETVFGDHTIPYTILGNTFQVSPTAFLQVNDFQAETLYKTALSAVNLKGKNAIDAYCGIGTISLAMAQQAKKVIGIELNPSSIDDAKRAAKRGGILNAEFLCGKCENLIPNLLNIHSRDTVLFVDPPRSGMEKSLIKTIADANINELVYISCDPSTLARDISRLTDHGYTPLSLTPIDMFPCTAHVETVVMMSRVAK